LTGKNYTHPRDYSLGSPGVSDYINGGYEATVGTVQNMLAETTRFVKVAETQAYEQAVQEWEKAQNKSTSEAH
jgi:hypothetical protein